jgi:hypothetical protein
MAKSETATAVYDADETQQDDLSRIPEATEISGPWVLQFRGGAKQIGVSDKGPWAMLSTFFVPLRPVGEQEVDAAELAELPAIKHRTFYTRNSDKRAFVKLMALMGAEPDPELRGDEQLKTLFDDARGEVLVATVKLGKDNRGDPEYKLSAFKAAS